MRTLVPTAQACTWNLPRKACAPRSCALSVEATFHADADQIEVPLDQVGTADEIALHLVAGLARQEGALGLRLHPFRDDRNVEGTREAQDRADDLGRLGSGLKVGDEAAVDLDLVERERLEIGQRGVPGAEIVHRDADAERLQPSQQVEGAGEIADQHALGDLDLEPRWRKSRLQQDLVDGPFEVAGLELDRR
jgi:hypothetical protein